MPGNPGRVRDETTGGRRTTARNPIMPRNRAMSVNPIISRNQAMPRSLSTHVQQKIPVKAAMTMAMRENLAREADMGKSRYIPKNRNTQKNRNT